MNLPTAQRLFDAYRAGLRNRERPEHWDYHPRFQDLLVHATRNRVRLPDRLPMRRAWRASGQTLRLARQGLLDEAASTLAVERRARAAGPPSAGGGARQGWLLGEAMLDSAQAYVEHRLGRCDLARQLLLRTMDADLVLEAEGDLAILQIHRLQSALNLMRVDLHTGRHAAAFALAGGVLAFLEDLGAVPPVHHSWRRADLRRTPRAVRRAMVTQVANDTAVALARVGDPAAWRAFRDGLGTVPAGRRPALHQPVRRWLDLKDAQECGERDRYLSLALELLPFGRRDVGPIWYCCVLDLCAFCRLAGSPPALQVAAAMLRDSARWPAMPASLRACVDAMRGR
jgi:hypothetical protein